MADQSTDSSPGWFAPGGLLGFLRPGSYDPHAAYAGLLTDPETKDAFRARALAGMAAAMGEASRPVPYKGGMPWGSFLGAAAGGAYGGEDDLIKARLQEAQSQQAQATAGTQQANAAVNALLLQKIRDRMNANAAASAGGGGNGLLTPDKLIASQGGGGGGGGGISATDHYSFLLNNGASANEAAMLTSAANSESSFKPDLTHDGGIGYGLYGHNTERLAAMRKYAGVGPNDAVPWHMQALYALAELRGEVKDLPGGGEPKAGGMVRAATNPEQLTAAQLQFERPKGWNTGGGNREQRLASTTEYLTKPPYLAAPPPTAAAPAPGAPQVAATPPMAPPAAPPSLLDTSRGPLGSSAAPPQLMTPPAAPPPGQQGLLQVPPGGPGGGGAMPAAAAALSPNAQAIAAGMQRVAGGGPAAGSQFAGPGAAAPPPSGPQPVPHTGAAGAAELQGLLNAPAPPPGAVPGPQPAPATPAPPPPPAPIAPPSAPTAAPPPPAPPPPLPPEMAAHHFSNKEIGDAQDLAELYALSGRQVPPDIAAIATLPTDLAKQEQAARLKGFYDQQKALYDKQLEIWGAPAIAGAKEGARVGPQQQIDAAQQALITQRETMLRQLQAGYDTVEVPVSDGRGGTSKVTMTRQQASDYLQQVNKQLLAGPGGGALAPGAPAGIPYYTPAQEEEQKGIGKTLAAEYQQIVEDQTASSKAKPYLLSIQQALQTFNTPGAGAQTKIDAWKGVQTALGQVGLKLSDEMNNWIASGEVMGKSGTQLGFELARSLGPRESQMIVQQAIKNNPGLGTTLEGNKQLIQLMGSIMDRNEAKREFYDNWAADPAHRGSFLGAASAFNKANRWEVTVSQFAPYRADLMEKDDYSRLPNGVRVIAPDANSSNGWRSWTKGQQ